MARTRWAPTSQASTPVVFPPHPPLQSGGWYRGATVEAVGPGRLSVAPPRRKSGRVAVLLAVLCGPFGLLYLSTGLGLFASVGALVALGAADLGFLPLVALWPVAVLVAARVGRHL